MSEALTATSSTSCSSFNNSIRKNPEFADVLLLIGPSKAPIWAHANILSEGCDYYKTALASRWIGRGEPSPIPQCLDIGSKVVRAVINHPDVDLETMTIVLEFIYAKTVIVPVHLLSKVALFADQLVLTDLVDECVKFIKEQVSEKNAFEYYMIGQRLDNMKLKVSSLRTISRKLNECIKEGKSVLAELDSDGICDIVQFRMFDATQKWMLSIVWIKSRQGLDDISFDSGISDSLDVECASQDIKILLSSNKLFAIPRDRYYSHIAPYISLLEDSTQTLLKSHLDIFHDQVPVDSPMLFLSRILSSSKQQHQFWIQLKSNIKFFQPNRLTLLYRASEHAFSTAKFHELCKGKANTVTLIKTVGEKIIGGYCDARWVGYPTKMVAEEAFLLTLDGPQLLMTVYLGLSPRIAHLKRDYGPVFGFNSLTLQGSLVSCGNMGVFDMKGMTAHEFLGLEPSKDFAICIEYEVFQLQK